MFDIGGEFLPSIPFRKNIQNGRYERNHLQDLGFILGNASGPHVELLVFIQLASTRAVSERRRLWFS